MAYIGTKPTVGNFQICDAISVVNGQAAYTMQVGGVNVNPQSANHMIVSLNGTIQKPNSSFTVANSVITFSSNLATGDVIDFIQILGDVLDLGVPSDATVTNAKISYPLTQSGATVSKLNRTTNNGDILEIQRLGTTVGSIGTPGSGSIYFTEATYGGLAFSSVAAGDITPCTPTGAIRDNATSLGQPSARFKDAYISQGIYLGGTGTANQLDDYEVGTWTPSVASTSGSFTTVGTVAGYYTKIGNMVHFQADIRITTNGTASANINVNGLPFTSANPGLDHTVNMARETQINGATFTTIISANVTQLVMLSPPFGNGAGYCINGVYKV